MYETVLDMWLASGTLTEHVTGRPFTCRMWGQGGGADGDNNTGQSGGGGGAECRVLDQPSATDPSYDVNLGTTGASGVLGVGTTVGQDSTLVGSVSGELLRAKGGGRGIAGNPTGTGGAGGTGGSGGVGRAGSAGLASATAANGGSSGGSLTAATSETVPGEPDGGLGNTGSATVLGPGAGGRVATDGVTVVSPPPARATLIYDRTEISGYPYIGATPTYLRDTSDLFNRTITLPGSHTAGDRIALFAAIDGAGAGASMTGAGSDWTELIDLSNTGNNATLAAYAINSTGSEDTTLTTTTQQKTNWFALRVKKALPVASWEIQSAALEATTTINIPSLTYSGGNRPILWVAILAWHSPQSRITAFPASWGQRFSNPSNAQTGSPAIAVCMRRSTGAASPSGSFTVAGALSGRIAILAIPLGPLFADTASYSFTGGAATFSHGVRMDAAQASFTLSGGNIAQSLPAGTASYTASVGAASFALQRKIIANAASYSLAVNDVALDYGSIFTQAPSSRTSVAGKVSRVVKFYRKDPTEYIDYTLNWAGSLQANERILVSGWEVESDESPSPTLVVDSSNFAGSSTSVWISGGTNGENYYLVNRVITSRGRTYERSLKILSRDSHS